MDHKEPAASSKNPTGSDPTPLEVILRNSAKTSTTMIAHGYKDTDSLLVEGPSDIAMINIPAVLDHSNVSPGRLQQLDVGVIPRLLEMEHERSAKKMKLSGWNGPEARRPTPRFLPPELWDHVVSYLRYDLDALLAYGEAYPKHGWDERAHKYVPPEYGQDQVVFSNRKEVVRIGRMKSTWTGPIEVIFEGRGSIPHLCTFAAMLGGKWTRTRCLSIEHAEWPAWGMPPDIFRNLSTFTGITDLYLNDVTFSSIATFGRLICALPDLEWLTCGRVRFETRHFNRAVLRRGHAFGYAFEMWLSHVILYDLDSTSFDDITGFFLSMGISANRTSVRLGLLGFSSNVYPLCPSDFLSGSIQRFLQSSGASLRQLDLCLVPGEYPIDISHNTKLTKFRLSIHIDNVDFNTGCIIQLVSQLTSKVMKEITIALYIRSMTINRPEELNAILARLLYGPCSQLDHIFTRPVFDKLTKVNFEVRSLRGAAVFFNEVRALWETLVQSQMPTLHKRGILSAYCFDF